jgi:hypothetical protein
MSGFQPEDEVSITSIRSGVCGNPEICDEHIPTNCRVSEEVNTLHFLCKGMGSNPIRDTIWAGSINGKCASFAQKIIGFESHRVHEVA